MAPGLEREQRLLEAQTACELRLDDLRLAGIRLSSRARKLEAHADHEEAMRQFAQAAQAAEEAAARRRAKLVREFRNALKAWETSVPALAGTSKVVMRELAELQARAAELHRERAVLERMEREDARVKVQMDCASGVLCSLTRANAARSGALEEERLRCAEMEARQTCAQARIRDQSVAHSALAKDQAAVASDVEYLRAFTGFVKDERDRDAVVDRFVTKHVSRQAPAYVPQRASQAFETARAHASELLAELDKAEKALASRCESKEQSPHKLTTSMRLEVQRLQDEIFASLSREERAMFVLTDLVTN